MKDFEPFAIKAYAAYGKTTNFLNFQGNPMPAWEELPEKIKHAWMKAAECVYDATLEERASEHDRPGGEE